MVKPQVLMLEILNASKDHLSAQQMHLLVKQQLPSIALQTITRNLNQLVSMGRIRKVCVPEQADCYESTLHEHQHLFCEHCMRLSNIHIEGLQRVLEVNVKEPILTYDVCIHYICDACRKKLQEAQ